MVPRNSVRPANGVIGLTVLAFLSEQPQHPYEIQRLIRERHKDFAAGKTRALYHAVDRLQRDGLIATVETSRDGRRPERTVYEITEYGRDKLRAWLGDLVGMPAAEFPTFMVALSFLLTLPMSVAASRLRERIVMLEAAMAGTSAAMRTLREEHHLPRLVLLENEFVQSQRQAELAWVRSLLADIETGRLRWDWQNLGAEFRKHDAEVPLG